MQPKHIAAVILMSLAGLALAADNKPIEPDMVVIKAGTYTMGSNSEKNASPEHTVSIKTFKMGKYEVTVEEFARFVEATNYQAPQECTQMAGKQWFAPLPGSWQRNTLSHSRFEPVTCIGVKGVEAYIAWLAKETGKPYRLPTEAEWEYADRAGSTQTYPWGDNEAVACGYSNVADRSAEAAIKRDYDGLESKPHVGVVPCDDQSDYASIVGMYAPNAFGLYDMQGNASEFVQDCMKPDYTSAPRDGSAVVDGRCEERVLRGGNWHWPVFASHIRGAMPVDFVGALEGFRVALDMDGTGDDTAKTEPSAFAIALAAEQKKERERRSTRTEIPAS